MSLVGKILIVSGLLLLAVALLSVRVILKKNGRFRSMHISDSRAMRERGIGCVQSQDREARRPQSKKLNIKEL